MKRNRLGFSERGDYFYEPPLNVERLVIPILLGSDHVDVGVNTSFRHPSPHGGGRWRERERDLVEKIKNRSKRLLLRESRRAYDLIWRIYHPLRSPTLDYYL